MDDEGRRLAALTDEEWAARMRAIEAEYTDERRQRKRRERRARWARRRPTAVVITGLAALVAAAAFAGSLLLFRDRGSAPVAGPTPATSTGTVTSGPFGNSPAAAWRDAAVALTIPQPPAGPLAPAELRAALDRVRTYLLDARTSPAVLLHHDVSVLRRQLDPLFLDVVDGSTRPPQLELNATFLAPGNRLAAPVRLSGTVTDSVVPASAGLPARLEVDVNVVWAYALTASYDVAPIGAHVVAVHDRLRFDFFADEKGHIGRPALGSNRMTFYDTDCGYFAKMLIGLPRRDDPLAAPGSEVDPNKGFDPNAPFENHHDCQK